MDKEIRSKKDSDFRLIEADEMAGVEDYEPLRPSPLDVYGPDELGMRSSRKEYDE